MPDRVIEKEGRSWKRWLPPVLLAACLLILWTMLFTGGMKAVYAWAALQVFGLVAGSLLLAALVYVAMRRRLSVPLLATFALGLFATWPALWASGHLRIAFPSSLHNTEPAAVVRLPSDFRLMVAHGGDDLRHNYHVSFPSQRWAYDLTVEPIPGSGKLENYGCYGTSVLAPADGLVTHVTDSMQDLQIGSPGDTKNPFGNVVVLKLETGTYLIIAHMQQSSVQVKVGDKVSEGEVLGACGNSGNTNAPHIHIQHQRQDPMTSPAHLAEGLPLYFKDVDGSAMPLGGFEQQGRSRVFIGEYVRHRP